MGTAVGGGDGTSTTRIVYDPAASARFSSSRTSLSTPAAAGVAVGTGRRSTLIGRVADSTSPSANGIVGDRARGVALAIVGAAVTGPATAADSDARLDVSGVESTNDTSTICTTTMR